MKRLTIVATLTLLLTACSSTSLATMGAEAAQPKQLNIETALAKANSYSPNYVLNVVIERATLLQQQQRTAERLANNKIKIDRAVSKVKKYKGKTWYVFAGSSPYGWDCSGLVRWTYKQMGVTLEHSATKQMRSGKAVKSPMVGDIVAFYYPGSKNSFHVGLYLGKGKMIHSYRPGVVTRTESVAGVAKENGAKYKYIRILPQAPATDTTVAKAKVEQP